jgi:hypothetical protein
MGDACACRGPQQRRYAASRRDLVMTHSALHFKQRSACSELTEDKATAH